MKAMARSSSASNTLRLVARALLGLTRGLGATSEVLLKRFLRVVVTECTAEQLEVLKPF